VPYPSSSSGRVHPTDLGNEPDDGRIYGTENPSRSASSAGVPPPGSLRIKETRSWQTWQLIVAAGIVGLVCMWIGNLTAGSQATAGTVGSGAALPPPSSSNRGSTGSSTGGSTATTYGSGSKTTGSSVPPSGSTSTTVSGPETVLLAPPQSTATNWTSPTFTIGGGSWSIGWAFQCNPAPVSGPAFQVFVAPSGGSPSATPAVSETGASGQSVTSQSSVGTQELVVKTATGCTWIVKVTGVA
jgi:hypothetical protein